MLVGAFLGLVAAVLSCLSPPAGASPGGDFVAFAYDAPADVAPSRGLVLVGSAAQVGVSEGGATQAAATAGHVYDSVCSLAAPSGLADDAVRLACSFSAETEVLMADGTTRPISEIAVGEWVLAEDPETGERGPRQVTHVWVHDDTIIDLEIDDHRVGTTEDHPFWNETDSEWQRADVLDPGDLVLTADGATLTVDGLDWGSARTTSAYNLTVDDIDTYYVQVSDEPVLVHNVCFDDAITTSHGRQRLVEAGFDDLSIDVLRTSDTVYEQADGALVHVAQTGRDAFDFVVIGDNGIVTAHRGFSRWELDGLAYNHDWLGYP